MNAIWYFALWAFLIFLLMRFGCGAHVVGHGNGHRQKGGDADVPQTAIDPVCGMSVEPKAAKTSAYEGRIYYFCSADCREKFESAPKTYLKGGASQPTPMEGHHGAH